MGLIFRNDTGAGGIRLENKFNQGRTSIRNLNIPPLDTGDDSDTVLYSNFDTYIIDGERQANTSATIRSNITLVRRLIVTEPVVITSISFVRISTYNWTTMSQTLRPTLSIVNGTGASIDGGVNSKQFYGQSVVYKSSILAERVDNITQYDIYTMTPTDLSTTELTAGEYSISIFSTGANFSLGIMFAASFPIDTSYKIYPSPTAATNYIVMEIV